MKQNQIIKATRLTANKHYDNGEDLFCIGVGTDVTKANRGETGEGEVERSYVLRL